MPDPATPRDPREICFVLMPYGTKRDQGGRAIQFDDVYRLLVHPAVADAGLRPLRSDEENHGGIIHKQMFERLLLCPFAVADLSTGNANVFYEVGVRHAARPHTSVLIFSDETDLRFDIQPLRSLRYGLDQHGSLNRVDADRAALTQRLLVARDPVRDSPLFELFQEHYRPPELAHEIADTFHDQVQYSEDVKHRLNGLRARYKSAGKDDAVKAAVRDELGAFEREFRSHRFADAGSLVAILLTWRACDAHADMVRLVESFPDHLRTQKLVREQYAFALNRLGRRPEAQGVLEEVIRRFGADPETCGLLGRVFKDMWMDAARAGDEDDAKAALERAIEIYLRGYEADLRDFYPGVNAVTLMDVAGDSRRDQLLPVVRYATERRIASLPTERQDYWEHATLLELAVLAADRPAAKAARSRARQHAKEAWFLATTANNLRVIALRRRAQGHADVADWIESEAAALTA